MVQILSIHCRSLKACFYADGSALELLCCSISKTLIQQQPGHLRNCFDLDAFTDCSKNLNFSTSKNHNSDTWHLSFSGDDGCPCCSRFPSIAPPTEFETPVFISIIQD